MAAGWHCLEELKFVTTWEDHVSDYGLLATNVAAPRQSHRCKKSHHSRRQKSYLGSCKSVVPVKHQFKLGHPMTEVQECVRVEAICSNNTHQM